MVETSKNTNNIAEVPGGWNIISYPSAPSSNDLAHACLEEKGRLAHGQCFVVGEQTKGRGRLGRDWVSRSGDGLYFSAVLCPQTERANWPSLSFAVSLAVLDCLREISGKYADRLSLKWPNDILLDHAGEKRKIAGILLEASAHGVIAGCGINLRNAPVSHAQKHKAVALDSLLAEQTPSPCKLAPFLASHLAQNYQLWLNEGRHLVIERWQSQCKMKKELLSVQLGDQTIKGVCAGFGKEGELHLRVADNQLVKISAGDVEIMKGK